MKSPSLRLRFALAVGLLSTLVVVLFAILSGWRFYCEQLDVDTDQKPQLSAAQLSSARDEVMELVGVYLVSLPVIVAIAAGCAWWIGGRLTRPLVTLANAADRIDAHTLHERVPETRRGDEISRVSSVFNRMLDRLEKSFAQARRFSADASHELRTPLAVMRARIEIAINRDPTTPQAADLAGLLEDNQQLTKITEGLLSLARADAGKLMVEARVVDLTVLLEGIVEDFAIIARHHAIQLETNISKGVFVKGDPQLLRQLLLNLFENAVKYNQDAGKIEASLLCRETEAVFIIANTGDTIPVEMQHRLFERFFRVAESRDRESGGAGLGLSLGLEIAMAHGGGLKLVSSDPDRTTFQVTLPLQID